MQNIVILGAGALGAAYASLLFEMDPQSVAFLAHGERAERLKADGVEVNGRHYDIPVISPRQPMAPADLVIVALKHQHLDTALPDLQPVVGPETLLLSVMNGLDSERAIGDLYGHDNVLPAIAVGIDAVREGNRTIYSQTGKIMFGEWRNPTLSDRVKRVQALFERAGIGYDTPEDMTRTLWWKFMINVGINQASAVLGAPYGVFHQSEDARDLMTAAIREVLAVAQPAGVNITDDDLTNWHCVLATLSPEGKTSMLQDVEAGRKTEVEMFAGKVIDLGRQDGIPTPVNQALFSIIRVFETQRRNL